MSTTPTIDELLTCAEAARRVNVSRSHLTALAKDGTIPSSIGFGGRRLVRWQDVRRWAELPVDPAKGGRPRGSGNAT